jgi:hypothetical protein
MYGHITAEIRFWTTLCIMFHEPSLHAFMHTWSSNLSLSLVTKSSATFCIMFHKPRLLVFMRTWSPDLSLWVWWQKAAQHTVSCHESRLRALMHTWSLGLSLSLVTESSAAYCIMDHEPSLCAFMLTWSSYLSSSLVSKSARHLLSCIMNPVYAHLWSPGHHTSLLVWWQKAAYSPASRVTESSILYDASWTQFVPIVAHLVTRPLSLPFSFPWGTVCSTASAVVTNKIKTSWSNSCNDTVKKEKHSYKRCTARPLQWWPTKLRLVGQIFAIMRWQKSAYIHTNNVQHVPCSGDQQN